MYSFDSRVRYSETDVQKRLTPASIINYFQDCSIFHSEDVGVGINHLSENHRAWIMCSWQLEILRYPYVNEKITVGTWAYKFKGMYGYRNFIMQDEKKQTVAVANSIWALMDTQKKCPAKIEERDISAYAIEPPYPMEYCDRKILIPEQLTLKEPFPVNPVSLDMFHHVNNGQYIRFGQNYIPDEFPIGQVRAEYRKSAVLGDIIYPYLHTNDSTITVVLADKDQHPFAVLEYAKEAKCNLNP